MRVETVTAAAFKAKCSDFLNRLASHDIERLIVTKEGDAVAVLTPPDEASASSEDCMATKKRVTHT